MGRDYKRWERLSHIQELESERKRAMKPSKENDSKDVANQIFDLLKRGGWVHLDSWLDKPNFSWGYEPMCNLKNDNCPFTMILVGQYCDTLSAACDHREYRKHTRRQVLAGEGERV